MIIIVDYKMGNIGSVVNMLKKIGVKSKLSANPEEILCAEKLLLPGVGSFDSGMRNLQDAGLIEVLNKRVLIDRIPILGICLGMQLLMDNSEEGSLAGLGWINGEVKRFDFGLDDRNLKVPHMGWNIVNPKETHTLFKDFEPEGRFYFVHSYYAKCKYDENILGVTNYGYEFTSCIRKENIFGAQFHPEKSHKFGMKILKNFAEMNQCLELE